MQNTFFPSKPKLLCLLLSVGFSVPVLANEETPVAVEEPVATESEQIAPAQTQQLETIKVRATRPTKNLGKETVRRQKLDENMVQDIYDMVRYDPAISVVEGGRAGSNGFVIRGVDKDRVAITVDGLAQGESRSSTAFQELFGAYGNFNTNRNAAELENISEVSMTKGADSISSGSGAIGGAVAYKTKSASDYLNEDKNLFFGLKSGYQSKSRSWVNSATVAGQFAGVDALLTYTQRRGHETKTHKDFAQDESSVYEVTENHRRYRGTSRSQIDPSNYKSKGTLFKIGYHFNENNYLNYIFEDYRQDKYTVEQSNLFTAFSDYSDRIRNDVSYRKRWGFEYENVLTTPYAPWDKLKLSFDKQNIKMSTMTWDIDYKNINVNPRTASAPFKNRVLKYQLSNAKLAADKQLSFHNDTIIWDLSYGLGLQNNRSNMDNLEEERLVYYPDRHAANPDTKNFLVGSKSKTRFAYLNNTLRFGKWGKMQLAARHDSTTMTTLEDPNTSPKLKEQLQDYGVWNKRNQFRSPSYSAALDWNVTPNITLQGKFSTGFRIPTTDEMYFAFPSTLYWVKPNPDLRPEKARTLEYGVDFHGKWGNAKLSAFRSDYKDFIDFHEYAGIGKLDLLDMPYSQNANRARAQIKGLEWQSHVKLDTIGLPKGMFLDLSASYQKGKASKYASNGKNPLGKVPLNALQPFNGVISLGYVRPDKKWSLISNFSYFARKNPKDTVLEYNQDYNNPDQINPYARHTKNIWLVDILGHYQINKNMSLRAGVFNVFNKKYYTWDSLRSIREFGAVNRVNKCNDSSGQAQHANCAHAGIGRFGASGRNFSLTFEAKF